MKIGKKFLLISLLVVVLSASIFAGHNWKRVNYMDSTIFSAIVTVDNKPAKAGDIVGAFVGTECRMIATVFMNNDTAYISSVIHGLEPEKVQFKFWQAETDKIFEVDTTITSIPGGSVNLFKINVAKK